MVLFPLQLHIGPHTAVAYLTHRGACASNRPATALWHVVSELKLKGLVSMIESQSLRQRRLLMAVHHMSNNHSSAAASVRVNFLNNFDLSTRSICPEFYPARNLMSESQTKPAKFAKVLKSREVVALAFGAMIGWSWVLMTGVWLTDAGSLGTLIAFSIGGFAIALIGLTYSELASAMPKAGGEHIYTKRALETDGHSPALGLCYLPTSTFAYLNRSRYPAR